MGWSPSGAEVVQNYVKEYEELKSLQRNLGVVASLVDAAYVLSVTFVRNVTIRGFKIHHHLWFQNVRVYGENGHMLLESGSHPKESEIDWIDSPHSVPAGRSIKFAVLKMYGVKYQIEMLGLVFLFTCNDGSDESLAVGDMYWPAKLEPPLSTWSRHLDQ